jgi:hypothetical protein
MLRDTVRKFMSDNIGIMGEGGRERNAVVVCSFGCNGRESGGTGGHYLSFAALPRF